MKKERAEFTILRYLGRPPSLFDDQAIAEVQKILEGNSTFNWDTFTEYAIFHKLSQTLYPNLRKFENAEMRKCENISNAEIRKCENISNAKIRKCENGENDGKNSNAKIEDGNTEEELAIHASPTAMQDTATNTSAFAVPTARQENHKEDIEDGNTEEELAASGNANVGADLCVCPIKKIPEFVINKFRGIFLANAARNEFLAQELVKINRLLEDNGIEVLNWKGPTLALQAYGDLSLRQFQDIDTLVKKEDLEKAKAVLLENGFSDITPTRLPGDSAGRGYEFRNEKKRYELEVEEKLLFGRAIMAYNYEQLFQEAASTNIDKTNISSLKTIDNLFFLSFHGTKHLWFRLRWLADIIALYDSNRNTIISDLEKSVQQQICKFCIYLAHTEFMLPITEEDKQNLEFDNTLVNIGNEIHKGIQASRTNYHRNNYKKVKYFSQLLDGKELQELFLTESKNYSIWNNLKRKITPNQIDYNYIRLPKTLWFLYFAIRPTRVVTRFIKKKMR